MPQAVLSSILDSLGKSRMRSAPDPIRGRRLALQKIKLYRNKRWHQQRQTQQRMLDEGRAINQRLVGNPQRKPADPVPNSPSTSSRANKVSANALQLQQSLQWTDAEITRLQANLAAMQTARNVYAGALRTELNSRDRAPHGVA
jgi:hypothetical protein